jgi:hypothetical protein
VSVQPVVRRAGDTSKAKPFTILVVANPGLEIAATSGAFAPDPILQDQAAFDACTRYIEDALFGLLAGQADPVLGVDGIRDKVRMLSLFDPSLAGNDRNSLVAQDGVSNLLIARRDAIRSFLAAQGLFADVVFAVSASRTHTRASAWFSDDDEASGGIPFVLDGVPLTHYHFCRTPGTVALPVTATSLTAAHEFQHAISSYQNGSLVDLYVDSPVALNCKHQRPVPTDFARYETAMHASDPTRGPLGYPAGWTSYHCALIDGTRPAMMDNYWLSDSSQACQNDTITRRFVQDRVRAKLER